MVLAEGRSANVSGVSLGSDAASIEDCNSSAVAEECAENVSDVCLGSDAASIGACCASVTVGEPATTFRT